MCLHRTLLLVQYRTRTTLTSKKTGKGCQCPSSDFHLLILDSVLHKEPSRWCRGGLTLNPPATWGLAGAHSGSFGGLSSVKVSPLHISHISYNCHLWHHGLVYLKGFKGNILWLLSGSFFYFGLLLESV